MSNKRSEKRKSASVTLGKKILQKLKQIAAKTNTNVSNLIDEITREKYGIEKDEEQKNKKTIIVDYSSETFSAIKAEETGKPEILQFSLNYGIFS